MAAQSFIKASDAAAIGGVSVAQLGCSSGDEFPTKAGFVNSGGAFDFTRLEDYDDEDFVLENDVVIGSVLITLAMSSDVESRGRVQLDDGTIATSVAEIKSTGAVVTAKCVLYDASDIFLGWYDSNDDLVSTDQNYAFTVVGDYTLYAKVAYMDLSTDSMEFGYAASSSQIAISSNVDWNLT